MKKMLIMAFLAFVMICSFSFAEEKAIYELSKDDIKIFVENKEFDIAINGRDLREAKIVQINNSDYALRINFTETGKDKFARLTTQNGNRNLIIGTCNGEVLFSNRIREPLLWGSIYISITDSNKLDSILLYVENKKLE